MKVCETENKGSEMKVFTLPFECKWKDFIGCFPRNAEANVNKLQRYLCYIIREIISRKIPWKSNQYSNGAESISFKVYSKFSMRNEEKNQ